MQTFTAKYVFDGSNLLENTAVLVDNKTIIDIAPVNNLKQKPTKDYGNCIITPGFIDLQLNGCGGVLFNDDISHSCLETMYQTCLKYGTTSFLPTLITCDFKDVIKALETIKSWFEKYGSSRGIIGLHLEGPFISAIKKGIHPEEFIIKPNDQLLSQIVSYQKYFPIKMTIAVEEFTSKQIKFLVDNKIIVAIGHSNATYEQALSAINFGVKAATHTFNAMSGLTARTPGVIGAILNNSIYNGLIADMLHVDKANIQLLTKLKSEYTYLVTDAVTAMGTKLTQFKLGGKTIYVKNGQCIDENNVLGGARVTMPESVANCVNHCNIPLAQTLNMATYIPAKLMGYENSLGKIAKGYRSDLIAFDVKVYSCQIVK